MFNSNLLPGVEKKEVKREETRRIITFFSLGTAVMFLLASVLLLPSYLPLFSQRQELERSLDLERQISSALGVTENLGTVIAVRRTLASVRDFLDAPRSTSGTMQWFFDQAGADVALQSLSLREGGLVSIGGVAKTRRALLDFEKKLRESGRFQDIASPLSNIIQEANINFTMQGKMKSLYAP